MNRAVLAVAQMILTLQALAVEIPRLSKLDEVIASNASGCVTTSLPCGITTTGSLGLGDCTFSDGTYYDRYSFAGVAGQIVDIEVRPLDATMTRPMIVHTRLCATQLCGSLGK